MGTVLATWAAFLVVTLAALVVGIPKEMGGMGLGSSAMFVAYGLGTGGELALLWLATRLLRHAGITRPIVVALLGTGLTVCLFVGFAMTVLAITSDPPSWLGLGLPLCGAAGFGVTGRHSHRAA